MIYLPTRQIRVSFIFFKKKSETLNTHDLLENLIPKLLDNYQWKNSMRWGEFELNWGRPLKSILSVFDKKVVNFQFYHISSSNLTFIDKDFEEKKEFLKTLNHMKNFLKKKEYLSVIIKEKNL